MRRHLALAALSVLPALAPACGDPPQKLSREEAQAQVGADDFSSGELPPNHPPLSSSAEASAAPASALSGVVEIAGELAQIHSGALFLIGYDTATGSMALVKKYDHAEFIHRAGGEVEVRFRLDQLHPTHSGELADLELEVRFDLDGVVDTKDDIVARVRIPVRYGDDDVHVRLDDGTRTEAPLPAGHGGN